MDNDAFKARVERLQEAIAEINRRRNAELIEVETELRQLVADHFGLKKGDIVWYRDDAFAFDSIQYADDTMPWLRVRRIRKNGWPSDTVRTLRDWRKER